jgi:hypothetical protein
MDFTESTSFSIFFDVTQNYDLKNERLPDQYLNLAENWVFKRKHYFGPIIKEAGCEI